MGIVERIKNLFKKEPDTKEYQEYKRCKEWSKSEIERFKKYIVEFSDVAKSHEGEKGPVYRNAVEQIDRFRYCLYEAEKTDKYIRPNTPDDIEYRNSRLDFFTEKLKEFIPADSNLRFHGTPIYFAEEILRSGGISSSADRFDGYIKSTDGYGEISVSDVDGLSRTVNYFLDAVAYQRCLPCGCLFVLTAGHQTEEQRTRSVMNNVNFNKEPERLYAIVTTPENIEQVKAWLEQSNLSVDLVYAFDDFLVEMEKSQEKELSVERKMALDDKVLQAMESKIDRATGMRLDKGNLSICENRISR